MSSDLDVGRIEDGARAILARNIFDSEGVVTDEADLLGDRKAEDESGALRPCEGLSFKVSTALKTNAHEGTFVVLEPDDAASSGVYAQEGDSFDGYTIQRIGWRHTVVTDVEGFSCYLDLYGTDDSLYLATDVLPESPKDSEAGRIARR